MAEGMRKRYAKRLLEAQEAAGRLMIDLIPKVYGTEQFVSVPDDGATSSCVCISNPPCRVGEVCKRRAQ
jgi:hypothetical protein